MQTPTHDRNHRFPLVTAIACAVVILRYLDSLHAKRNTIADPDLAEYFDVLRFVTTGPVFDWRRSVTAVRFALGGYDQARQRYLHKTWPDRS